jgi:hypothetical protein
MHLEIAIQALGYKGYFTGKTPCPTIPALAKDKANAANIKKAVEAKSLWKTCKSCARHVLVSTVPNITLCKIYSKKTIAKMWATVCSKYEDKTALAQSNMQVAIQAMCCKDNGNLCAHLDLMCKKKDDLAQARVNFTNKEFTSWIIGLLPRYYTGYILNLTSTAKLLERGLKSQSSSLYPATKSLLTSDNIIHFLKQEYDVCSCRQSVSYRTKVTALVAVSSYHSVLDCNNSNCNGRRLSRQAGADQSKLAGAARSEQMVCWCCGGASHHFDQCPSPATEEEMRKSSGGYTGTLKPLESTIVVTEGNNGYDPFMAMDLISGSEDEAVGATEAYDEGWFSDGNDSKPVGRRGLAAAAVDLQAPEMCALEGVKPCETLHGLKTNELQLCKFGCLIWMQDPLESKLDVCAHKG